VTRTGGQTELPAGDIPVSPRGFNRTWDRALATPVAVRAVKMQLRLLCYLLLYASADAGDFLFKDDPHVHELSPADFESEVLHDTGMWVVNFYADWCGHCVHYASEYKKAADALKDVTSVRLGALDCAKYHDLCSNASVPGYPTVRGFRFPLLKATTSAYGGSMEHANYSTAEQLEAWVRAQQPSAAKPQADGKEPSQSGQLAEAKGREEKAHASDTHGVPAEEGADRPAPPPLREDRGAEHDVAQEPEPSFTEPLPTVHLLDAEVAVLFSLHQGAFLKANATSGSPLLQGAPLLELCDWLNFLASTLPSVTARSDLQRLAEIPCLAVERSGALPESTWRTALEGQRIGRAPKEAGRDPSKYWHLCKTYTCGLWMLFHILSLVGATQDVEVKFLDTKIQEGPQVLHRIRRFVEYFFGCEDCASHFSETYDSCAGGRCDLKPGDGRGDALWLWRVHNNVTARVARERRAEVPEEFPRSRDCPACRSPTGDWEESSVYEYLRKEYFLKEWDQGAMAAAQPFRLDMDVPYMISSGLTLCATAFACFLAWARWRYCLRGRFRPAKKNTV